MAAPDYLWDSQSARYRDRRGRYLSRTAVRRALDTALRAEASMASGLADGYRTGRLGLQEFEQGMRQVVKNTQLYSAAAARGGWDRMTAHDYGRVGAQVREQYRWLARFAADLRAGVKTDGGFLARARRYAYAARVVYHQTEREVMLAAGYTHERNILGKADHCGECPTETRRGAVPIGHLIPIGRRECGPNCVCHVTYSRMVA